MILVFNLVAYFKGEDKIQIWEDDRETEAFKKPKTEDQNQDLTVPMWREWK